MVSNLPQVTDSHSVDVETLRRKSVESPARWDDNAMTTFDDLIVLMITMIVWWCIKASVKNDFKPGLPLGGAPCHHHHQWLASHRFYRQHHRQHHHQHQRHHQCHHRHQHQRCIQIKFWNGFPGEPCWAGFRTSSAAVWERRCCCHPSACQREISMDNSCKVRGCPVGSRLFCIKGKIISCHE